MRIRDEFCERDTRSRLFWGLSLVTIGVLSTMMYLHLIPGVDWSNWWPAIVVVFGLARMASAYSARSLGSGLSTALIGGWFFATMLHWHGLRWETSWPLLLVAGGLGEVVHAIALPFYRRRAQEREEGIHVPQ